ncbi:MAG: DUF302 domain-containing protein [Acidimicrobiales bacterium]
MSEPLRDDSGIVSKTSPHTVSETVRALTDLIGRKGLRLFGVIDQREAARSAGLDLRETSVVQFGNPALGTPIMEASPLVALDLPLKIVVWADGDETRISYYSPEAIAKRHGLSVEAVAPLAGIDALTDAIVSS